MKILKRILLLLVAAFILIVIINYPKLNIIAGYSAKNTASSVYLANRTLAFTDSTDNNFGLVKLADDWLSEKDESAKASVFGLLTREAVYRDGVGAVLTTKGFDRDKPYLKPTRSTRNTSDVYPYGNAEQKDSVFSNVNYDRLNETINSIFNKENKTRATVVIYKDQIIAEKYAEGFDKNSKILGWSMTKSIMSTVYGIMQYQGKIDVQDKTPIAAWQNDERSKITIHNLLQMNSGLAWDENYDGISDVTTMLFLQNDMTQAQKNKSLAGEINNSWNYSSGTSNLLSGILRQKLGSHQEYLDYWYREFIDKIGMNSMIIETDVAGNYVGSSYAWATPRDWGKFGLLYLHKGNWNGEQLFAPEWTDYVATPTPTSDGTYGAQFWLNAEGKYKDLPKNMFYADGFQGQFVFIFPDQDLVVVRMGLSKIDINTFLKGVLESID